MFIRCLTFVGKVLCQILLEKGEAYDKLVRDHCDVVDVDASHDPGYFHKGVGPAFQNRR
jgi:hypothetical protein